ncbi:MAG: GAF domain-containing protein [Chloroflexi bacterium]|nr:MAG: GAF domain-containing protein [Chloroflexota bacterium]
MNLALIIFLGGLVVILWVFFWSRQHKYEQGNTLDDIETLVKSFPATSYGEAVIVSREHGRVVYANEPARNWLGLNGDPPHLERIASLAEPADSLLDLFSREGQASFQLNKRWVEASSHRIPAGAEVRTVVVMRELASNTSNADVLNMALAMSVINEIGETINASMGMEQVLQALLTIISRAIPTDAGEINLWVEQEQVLRQRGWIGDAMYLIALSEAGGVYELGEGITGWIAKHRKPVLVKSRYDVSGILPKLPENPYNSFLGVPIQLGDRFIGTLEIAHSTPDAYTQGDLALLQAISNQIGVTIYNTEIYSEQARRIDDIAQLQRVVMTEDVKAPDAAQRVYMALNQRIAELLSADMCGIFLYDPDRQGLAVQLPVLGLPEALIRTVFIPLPPDSPQYDIWTRQQYWVSNDVVDEPLVEALGLNMVVSLAGIVNTAWMPLQLGDQRFGVLAVSNKRTEGGFTARDIQNLQVLAAQAAIVVENLRLYQREKRMDTELVGLQQITDAIGALSHETEFYGEITERIAQLMDIEMCGILLYDPDNTRLVSRLPFYGVKDSAVQNYTVPLTPGSVMEQLWEEETYWYSNRVASDPLVFEAGLDKLADQIGVEKTMMAVLQVSGRRIGVIQISNKTSGDDFTDNDARLLLIFATQTAAIIENARLYREARRSAEQAQGLRRVAELAGNVLTTEETFTPVLAEIAHLLKSEIVFINVLDEQKGSLTTYPRWVYGTELGEPITQNILEPGFEYSVAVSGKPYMTNDVYQDDNILVGYKEIAQKMQLRNGLVVPLIFGERPLGELGVANRFDGPYTLEDLEVMQVVAAQTAAALDRLLLYEATGENLNRRLQELDAISRVSNELTTTLDFGRILDVIREEAVIATGADDGTVVLLTPYAGDGVYRIDRRLGYDLGIVNLADIEIHVIENPAEATLISDYEFAHTFKAVPPDARSALAAAVVYLGEVVGVIHLFHHEPKRFDERAAAFLLTLASKAALGYGNAMRYQEQIDRSDRLRARVEQLNRIFELGHMFQTNTDPIHILEAIAYSVQQSVGFDTVAMLFYDADAGVYRRVAQAGMPLDVFQQTLKHVITPAQLDELFKPEFRISESYFFPMERIQDWYVSNIDGLFLTYDGNRTIEQTSPDSWRDGDLFVVRLQGPSGDLIGLMTLDRPHNNRRPDRGTVEVLEIFANQAASTIENTRLFLSSVQNAEQEARLSEVMEAVSRTLDIQEVVQAVAEGILRMVPYHTMTVALRAGDDQNFDVLRVEVQSDDTVHITREQIPALSGAMQRTYEEGMDYIPSQDDSDEDIRQWREQGEKSTLLLPLVTGGETLGVVHIGSQSEGELYEQRNLLKRVIQLVASSIQNARLFDQAVNLQILNESVVESIQQGIIVLDNTGQILSTNSFMVERFDWDQDVVGRDIFHYRPDMADVIRDALTTVFNQGIPQERINHVWRNAEDSQRLVNYYIYPLRFGLSVRGAVILIEDVTERARLEQAMETRANQLAALTEVSTRITSSLERDEVVQLALDEMGWLIPHSAMTIWRRNGSYMVLEGSTDLPVEEARRLDQRFMFGDFSLTHEVVNTQRVVVGDVQSEFPEDVVALHHNAASWMGVPLVNQGHVVGIMILSDGESGAYQSKSDQNIAFAFASQVAIALANADLFEQTFDRTNELGTLLEAAQATSLTTDLDSVFRTVVELMFSALEMDNCAIMIWDEVDNQLEVQLSMNRFGDENEALPNKTRLNLNESPARMRALRERDVVVLVENEDNPYPIETEQLRNSPDFAHMYVPLVVREKSIGLIQLGQSSSQEGITQQKVRLARALGAQVAVAIENARLSAETTAHFEESLIINDLSRAISSTLNLEDMLAVVRDQLTTVTGASELYLALYDSNTDEITFPLAVRSGEIYDIPPRQLNNDEVSFIIKNRRALNLGADYYSPAELRKSLGIVNGEGDAKSYLGVPLIAGDQVYGVLAVRDRERTRAFTINEQRILTTVGSQLGAAIQNARLFREVSSFADKLEQEVRQRTAELEEERDRIDTLYQITSELAQTLDMDQLIPRALGMLAKAIGADEGVIMQLDPVTDQLYSRAILGQVNTENGAGHPAESLARWLIAEDEYVYLVEDLQQADFWEYPESEWQSALSVMLETNEETLGVMVFLSRQKNAFHEAHLRLLVAAANQVASSINNAELYKMIREQAERLGILLRAEQEEADKNKAILEGIADGVVLSDADNNIILFNTAAERILRVPRNDVLGRSLDMLTNMYGEGAEVWVNAVSRRRSGGEQGVIEYLDERIELGDDRVVSVHLSPVYTGDKFLGTVSVFRDITREVRAERSKSQFMASVSHEFRTPLTSIKGYNDLLLMGAAGQLEEAQQRMLLTIKENVTRLTELVEDVLKIANIDADKENLNLSDVDLNVTIRRVLDNLLARPQHQNRNLKVTFQPVDNLPTLRADEEKVLQIINNVVDNAFNYTPAGGQVTIRANIKPDDDNYMQIEIQDTGVGIPPDFYDKIWERFERHDETAVNLDVAGTGLGLSIVKELVEMHKGDVWFESEVGVGTTFYITLPRDLKDPFQQALSGESESGSE